MSVHIATKKIGGFALKVAPYVLAIGGAAVACHLPIERHGPESPAHERKEYDEIMARQGVREAYLESIRKRDREAVPFCLGGLASLVAGLLWLGKRAQQRGLGDFSWFVP